VFSFFLVLKYDFIKCINFTRIAAETQQVMTSQIRSHIEYLYRLIIFLCLFCMGEGRWMGKRGGKGKGVGGECLLHLLWGDKYAHGVCPFVRMSVVSFCLFVSKMEFDT